MSDQHKPVRTEQQRSQARARAKRLLRRMAMLYVGILVVVGVVAGVASKSAVIGGIAVAVAVIVLPLITTTVRVVMSVRSVRAVGKAGREKVPVRVVAGILAWVAVIAIGDTVLIRSFDEHPSHLLVRVALGLVVSGLLGLLLLVVVVCEPRAVPGRISCNRPSATPA